MIIDIDGIDKIGKETQSKKLANRLGIKRFEYPNYESTSGLMIRKFLTRAVDFSPALMQMYQVVNKLEDLPRLKDAENNDGIVVTDRYVPSATAHGILDGFEEGWLWTINQELPMPDVVIILEGKGWTRVADYYEVEEKQNQLSVIYSALAKKHNWHIVKANRNIDDVHNDIMEIVTNELKS